MAGARWRGLQWPRTLGRSQGPYHPSAIYSLSVFQCPLQLFASKLHISWDSLGCSLCCSEDRLGVPAGHRENWALLLPTFLPPSHPMIPPTFLQPSHPIRFKALESKQSFFLIPPLISKGKLTLGSLIADWNHTLVLY